MIANGLRAGKKSDEDGGSDMGIDEKKHPAPEIGGSNDSGVENEIFDNSKVADEDTEGPAGMMAWTLFQMEL